MITWDREAVEQFLGLTSVRRESSPPNAVHLEYLFELPLPTGPILWSVRPELDHCQLYANDEEFEFVSAHVHCTKIAISDELKEEGGQCVVLLGSAGHACIIPDKPYFRLFFSMHGKPTDPAHVKR